MCNLIDTCQNLFLSREAKSLSYLCLISFLLFYCHYPISFLSCYCHYPILYPISVLQLFLPLFPSIMFLRISLPLPLSSTSLSSSSLLRGSSSCFLSKRIITSPSTSHSFASRKRSSSFSRNEFFSSYGPSFSSVSVSVII